MGKLSDWLSRRKDAEPLTGEVGHVYTKADADHPLPGRMPFPGTDLEVVAVREGDDLKIIVNRAACIHRVRLVGAFRTDLDVMSANVNMRDEVIVVGEVPADRMELARKLLR